MKYPLLASLLCLFAGPLQAQDSTSYHLLSLKLSPLAYFNVQTPCIQPGIELRLLSQLGIQAEYGFQCNRFAPFDLSSERKDWKYHRLKAELRYYFPLAKRMESFIGLGVFEVRQRYSKLNSRMQRSNGSYFDYDQSDIRRDTWGGLGKFGFTMSSAKHFSLEIIVGVGAKGVVISQDLTNPMASSFNPPAEYFPKKDEREGSWTIPIVGFEIMLGYTIFPTKK